MFILTALPVLTIVSTTEPPVWLEVVKIIGCILAFLAGLGAL